MFPLSPSAWLAIATAILIAGLGIAVKVQTSRLDSVKAEYATFKAQVDVLGREAEKAAKARELADKQRKEIADRENVKTKSDLAGVYAAYRSLRDSRSGSSILPAPGPGSAGVETASFDRAALDRALSGFDSGVTGLLEQGDKAIADLNTAKGWAK